MVISLAGRRVVLTGAAGHLGRAIANTLVAAGAELIVVGRNAKPLERLREALGERCSVRPADLSDTGAIERLVEQLSEDVDSLHGLVNNAYAGRVGTADALGAEDFDAACKINLTAPFLLSRGLAKLLESGATQSAESASIVNVASMYGRVSPDPALYGNSGTNNPAHYGATKAGLIQLTRYLACNLSPRLIRVNSVSPGPFPNLADGIDPAFLEGLECRVPLGRIGSAKEIAGPILFLLSGAASFINGADVAVDGGWTAW